MVQRKMTKKTKKHAGKKKEEKEIKIVGRNAELYQELIRMIQNVGDWNLNYNALVKEWDVPKTTLYRWKDKILSEMPPIDVKKVGDRIMQALDSGIRQANIKMRTAHTETEKARWAKVLGDLSKDMTHILESYGKKEKVPEKHEFEGSVDFGFMQQVYADTKQKKVKKK